MCRAYGINKKTLKDRMIKQGMTLEEALTADVKPTHVVITDPFGKKFNSLTDLTDYYKITRRLYNYRMNQGWPQLEALTFPPDLESPFPKETGVEFRNIKELCDYVNCSRAAIQSKLRKGRSLNEIIEKGVRYNERIRETYHQKAIIYGAYYNNEVIYVGQTIFALETRAKRHIKDCKTKCQCKFHRFLINHLNEVKFKVIEELHNISQAELNEAEKKWIAFYDTFHNGYNSTDGGENGIRSNIHYDTKIQTKIIELAKNGMSVERIVKEVNIGKPAIINFLKENEIVYYKMKKECKDHLGNTYPNLKEMAKAYSVNYSTFTRRLKDGWSVESALTMKPKKPIKIKDHLGNEFPNIAELCRFYNINRNTFVRRLEHGWPMEKALFTSR